MQKIVQLKEKMKQENIDALLISNLYNIRYLASFTGTTGLILVTLDKAYFITDFRYTEQAAEEAVGFEIKENKGPIFEEVAKIISDNNLKTLGFEENDVTYSSYRNLKELLSCELQPVSNFVEDLREIKTDDEIEIIQKAIQIAEQAYEYILGFIKPGMTEIEVANELDFYMRKHGASGVSFDTIVASGVRSAMPHGVASDKVIEQGDMITIDFGCYYNGYVSDMTRTFAMGEPAEELKKIHAIVLEANKKVTEQARAGMTGAEVDAIARDYITAQGYGDYFGHSTGHGIGLEVHEGPGVNSKNDKQLVENNVITNEPGIYIPGLGGVRIEDDLVIKKDGNINLNSTSKELIIL